MKLPYLLENKSHSIIRRTPKLGPELGTKFFGINLKDTLEMHEDTHSDHKSSSLLLSMFLLLEDLIFNIL